MLWSKFKRGEVACRYYGLWHHFTEGGPIDNGYSYQFVEWILDGTKVPKFETPSMETGGNLSAGQYANDPCEDNKVNFKAEVVPDKEGKLLPFLNLVCLCDSKKNTELFLSYGPDYWMKQANWDKLSTTTKVDYAAAYPTAWNTHSNDYGLTLD